MVSFSVFKKSKSVQAEYADRVKNEFDCSQLHLKIFLEKMTSRTYLCRFENILVIQELSVRVKPKNVRITFDAKMVSKPGAKPMNATSEQYNFYGSFTRLFLMKASKMFVPFHAFHSYIGQKATFVVRVANLFNIVDLEGDELTTAETVTLLNDMCIFVPGNLYDKRLSWKEIDTLSCQVTIENGIYKVSAILYFNETGELINFVSDDRYALQDDGTIKRARWSTPVGDYKERDGRKIPTYGETIWNYPEGDFTYGTFKLKDISYNVTY